MVRHPNIVQLLEVMETDNFYYLVTELCSGGELLDYICERKRLDENVSKKYVEQLVSAVARLHQSGIVHRYGFAVILRLIVSFAIAYPVMRMFLD